MPGSFTLHIRGVGGWTNRLYSYFEEEYKRQQGGEDKDTASSSLTRWVVIFTTWDEFTQLADVGATCVLISMYLGTNDHWTHALSSVHLQDRVEKVQIPEAHHVIQESTSPELDDRRLPSHIQQYPPKSIKVTRTMNYRVIIQVVPNLPLHTKVAFWYMGLILKWNFHFDVNGRFVTNWMVTL